MSELDCTKCGACCSALNRHEVSEGLEPVIPVTKLDRRRLPTKYKDKLTIVDGLEDQNGGVVYTLPTKKMVLRGEKHDVCVALKGHLGRDIGCDVYDVRPAQCRELVKGSTRCLEIRHEVLGVPLPVEGEAR